MTTSPAQPGLSALDRAYALRLDGEPDAALRLSASVLTATPADLGAAWLVARLLLDAGRPEPVAQLAERASHAAIARGDLPSAVLHARLLGDAGVDPQRALERIADAFGAGSARLSDTVAPPPPPLPVATEAAPLFANASGAALLDAVGKAASHAAQYHADNTLADASVPRLPLFSELAPPQLLRLLSLLTLRELEASEHAVSQGEDGREAFVVARGVLNVVREDTRRGPTLLAALGPGAIFGEMALVSDAPRAASVVAVEPTQLLCMPRPQLEGLAQSDPALGRALGGFCHARMLANLVRHSAVLAPLPAASRRELIARFSPRSFERNELLVQAGSEPGCVFLIASGRVQVRGTDTDGDRVLLAQLGPGDVVGEISLVLRRPANADVVATHRTVCLALSREDFHEVTREHPALLRELYDIAVQRDEETRSIVGQHALDASDAVLV